MTNTPNLGLPYLQEAQAQKHVTHNEALTALDAVIQLSVLDRTLVSPPVSPLDGARYIVAAPGSGPWSGKAQQIAAFQDQAWAFYAPVPGWLAWVQNEQQLCVYDSNAWTPVSDSDLQNIALLGVNSTADTTNRLAVTSPASLFSHEGNSHRLKINKNAGADTASVLFQTGWSGRAEFGTTGDDDWHVKVSADGSAWHEALVADKGTGAVRFPGGLEHAPSRAAARQILFTPGGDGTTSFYRIAVLRGQNPQTRTIQSISNDIITLTTTDASLFFAEGLMTGVAYVRAWNTSKLPAQPAWIKAQPASNQLQVLDSAAISGWNSNDILQLGDPLSQQPGRVIAVDISPMLQSQFGAIFPQAGVIAKLAVQGSGGSATAGLTADGAGGSFSNVTSMSNGDVAYGLAMTSCTTPSPISNSNLVLVREIDAGMDSVLLVSCISVGIIV